jgi:transposase
MLSERHDRNLDEWLGQAKHSVIAELNSFAQGLRRDYAAVSATFSSPWSNGQLFGHARFDLLRLCVLHTA